MASDCTEQTNTPQKPQSSNKRTSEQGEAKTHHTTRLRGSGPLRLAAATRCGLRLARQSSAAPTEGRIPKPALPVRPPSTRAEPSLPRRDVSRELHGAGWPEVALQSITTPASPHRVSRPVFEPPEEAQPPNHCTAAGLKGWGGGTWRGTGGCAQPEVGRGATAARDLSSAQC